MPRPATSGNAAKGMYVKADFVYDAERDVYVCQAGEDLIYRNVQGVPFLAINKVNGRKFQKMGDDFLAEVRNMPLNGRNFLDLALLIL